MVIIVTGGRDYKNRAFVFMVLDKLHAHTPITHLHEGGASGVDTFARKWAISRKVDHTTHEADWDRYRGRAGFVRNCSMLREQKPDLVVRFPGGKGTAHMAGITKAANVKLLDVCRYSEDNSRADRPTTQVTPW